MGRARYAIALVVALMLSGAPRPLGPSLEASAAPLRVVAADGVTAVVPSDWDFRPIQWTASNLHGLQASRHLDRWATGDGKGQGINAYWVDATRVRLPSDYYILAARGPAMESLPSQDRCRSTGSTVLLDGRRPHDLPRGYLATATGTCTTGNGRTRWAAFVAAPAFGPIRELGIPESGMYFAMASVRDGPKADQMLNRLLMGVSFGPTPVGDMLREVEAPGRLL